MKIKYTGLKFCFYFMLVFMGLHTPFSSHAAVNTKVNFTDDEPPVSTTEIRYEKLMKIYLNKIKLAFSETDDARSLEILNQFLAEFNQKSELLKKELQLQVKDLNPRQKELLYKRIGQRMPAEELIALLFDERVTSRLAANADLKNIMDELQTKSLEIQKTEREFIAVGQ